MTSVFAIQNDLALRYGAQCSPTSFLALRLKGIQKNQPDLLIGSNNNNINRNQNVNVSNSNNANYSTVSSSHVQNVSSIHGGAIPNNNNYQRTLSSGRGPSHFNSNQNNNAYSNNASVSSAMMGMMMGSGPTAAGDDFGRTQSNNRFNVSSSRQPSSSGYMNNISPSRRRSPSRAGAAAAANASHTSSVSAPENDIDALPLPAPGQLSAQSTLAKALQSDPEAHVTPTEIRMAPCSICHRSFDVTRLDRHIVACRKSAAAAAKRREFDAQELRVKKLYENDPLAAAKVLQKIEKEEEMAATGRAPPKKSTWRKKSAELNYAINGAATVGGGGGGGDLDGGYGQQQQMMNFDDRVPCPSCGKKFAEETARRHIPSCMERQKRNSFR